jgi:hypothetical protein
VKTSLSHVLDLGHFPKILQLAVNEGRETREQPLSDPALTILTKLCALGNVSSLYFSPSSLACAPPKPSSWLGAAHTQESSGLLRMVEKLMFLRVPVSQGFLELGKA